MCIKHSEPSNELPPSLFFTFLDASDEEFAVAPKGAIYGKAIPVQGTAPVAPPAAVIAARNPKFAGEDEEGSGSDDWDVSDSEKAANKKPISSGAGASSVAPKKKGTLKQKLAEKAEKERERRLNGGDDDLIDEMTPQERRRLEREMEIEADALNAADLVGSISLGELLQTDQPPSLIEKLHLLAHDISDPLVYFTVPLDPSELGSITTAQIKTKKECAELAEQISALIFTRLHDRPLYPELALEIARQVASAPSLKDVDVRKIGAAMGVIANQKQQEARDKASGKKKTASKGKPALGSNKALASSRADTDMYDEVLDDGDFM